MIGPEMEPSVTDEHPPDTPLSATCEVGQKNSSIHIYEKNVKKTLTVTQSVTKGCVLNLMQLSLVPANPKEVESEQLPPL